VKIPTGKNTPFRFPVSYDKKKQLKKKRKVAELEQKAKTKCMFPLQSLSSLYVVSFM